MLEVTKENFESEVLQAEGYVFVDFFGDGCVPCAALMPHVHALADKYADSKLKFCCMNTTQTGHHGSACNGYLQRWRSGRISG